MKWAYYNEIEPFAAQWLRNLIKAGVIAPGVVDERSISNVKPAEIKEFAQCHFFAGIGVWSYALRAAGWNDDRPVWTGSCPCQPFSSAGKRDGLSDERHLWPHWFHLIQMCRPIEIFGEQVASKDGLSWLDVVQTDLEEAGYTNAALDLCAAGFGAPHIRQRLYFYATRKLANSASNGWKWKRKSSEVEKRWQPRSDEVGKLPIGLEGYPLLDFEQAPIQQNHLGMEYAISDGLQRRISRRESSEWEVKHRSTGCDGAINAPSNPERKQLERGLYRPQEDSSQKGGRKTAKSTGHGETNGFWSDAEWIYCRDEKYRPIEPESFPLVNVPSERMVRESSDPITVRNHPKIRTGALKGYGNAIVAEVAKEFIKAAMKYKP